MKERMPLYVGVLIAVAIGLCLAALALSMLGAA